MESHHFIGVDVSQRTLDIAAGEHAPVVQIENTERAIRQWLKTVPEGARIAVESTGKLHRLLVRCAIAAGHVVYVLNARDLSHYARSLGRRAKTDRLDAQLLARYLAHEYEKLHPYRLPTKIQAKLDELVGRRHKVVVAQGALRQSLIEVAKELKSYKKMMSSFEALLKEIDQQLASLIAQDEQLAPKARSLRTMVGFGPLLSTSMAHAITRHPFKHSDAFIAYIGYDPRPRESGQKKGRRYLTKRGPAEMRRLLFTAAMSASKTKLWRPFYQRYRDRGLPSTAALVILARKLARIAFSIVKHGTVFDPQRIKNACACP
jgi:transposase